MKLLLATADVADIQWASAKGLLDGVITSPAQLRHSEPEDRERLVDICRLIDAPVYVTVRAISGDDTIRDARELARISDRIIVQIPFVEDTLGAVHQLTAEGVRVASFLVFNAAQALLAAKTGASAVVTPVDHLDRVGRSGTDIVRELRSVFDATETECEIVALGPTNAMQFADCALAGADAVAVSPDVLRELLVHPLTDRGLDQFLNEIAKQHSAWSAV